jgi:protein TonB
MRRAVEIIGFLGLSAAVHAGVVTGLGDGIGGAQGRGAEGTSQATLQAAPESLAALAERWADAPRPASAPPAALAQPTAPDHAPELRANLAASTMPRRAPAAPVGRSVPDAAPMVDRASPAPGWSTPALSAAAPSLPPPRPDQGPRPQDAQRDANPRRAAPPALTAPTRMQRPGTDRTAPPPPGSTEHATARSPRPPQRPDRPAPDTAAPSRAATSAPQPARVAEGQGGGATEGRATAETAPALSAGARQTLMSRWGAQIMARVERARPRVHGSGQVVLNLRVARNGRLTGLSVARSSGDAALDSAALAAVRRAGRFPAAPGALTEASYGFSLPIRFR